MRNSVTAKVLAVVNAPYGPAVDAARLAALLCDARAAKARPAPVFAFFSEVPAALQSAFIAGMGLDARKVSAVARDFSLLAGRSLPLAG